MAISAVTFILIMLFSIGSWIDINSIFSQLAHLVTKLPESYGLYSYFALAIQLANISPLIFAVLRRYYPRKMDERYAIYIILAGCTICMVVVAFVHDIVIKLPGGQQVSLPLLSVAFSLSLLDCLSTVTFYTFLSLFNSTYLAAYFLGQSLSGLLPSSLTLIQGHQTTVVECPTTTPLRLWCPNYCGNTTIIRAGKYFSTRIYFLIIASILFISFISFIIVNHSKHVAKNMSMTYEEMTEIKVKSISESYSSKDGANASIVKEFFKKILHSLHIMDLDTAFLLGVIVWISMLSNGVIVQIMSYTASPYRGSTLLFASNLYKISQALTNISFMVLKKFSSRLLIFCLTCLFTALSIAMIIIAVYARNGILIASPYGSIVVIAIFSFAAILNSSVKLVVCTQLRELGAPAMFMCGVATQFGSFSGTLAMFIPISVKCVFNK